MAECEAYESRISLDTDIKDIVIFLGLKDNNEIKKVIDPIKADYVVITKNIDSKLVAEYFDNYECYFDGLEEGKGIYVWDDEEEKWIKISRKITNLEDEIGIMQKQIDDYNKIVDKIYDKIS
jgi:hypothetical protein